MENTGIDKKDLKIQALLERLSATVTQYENQDAERRIEITLLSQRVQELEAQLASGNEETQAEEKAS